MLEQLKKRKYGIVIPLYALIYMTWFCYLEKNIRTPEHVIHLAIDDMIPFIDVFVIPYMLWFVYVSAVVLWLLWKDREEFIRLFSFLAIGMTIFLIVSTLYTNGQTIRPTSFDHVNLFTRLVQHIYKVDSPNNILPSIHVYNSLVTWFAVHNSRFTAGRPRIRAASLVLTTLIILSTMFIKQHSVLDVTLALLMAMVFYPVFYMEGCPLYYRKLFPAAGGLTAKQPSGSRE